MFKVYHLYTSDILSNRGSSNRGISYMGSSSLTSISLISVVLTWLYIYRDTVCVPYPFLTSVALISVVLTSVALI